MKTLITQCKVCNKEKESSKITQINTSNQGICHACKQKKWRSDNPETVKEYNLKAYYKKKNLTPEALKLKWKADRERIKERTRAIQRERENKA